PVTTGLQGRERKTMENPIGNDDRRSVRRDEFGYRFHQNLIKTARTRFDRLSFPDRVNVGDDISFEFVFRNRYRSALELLLRYHPGDNSVLEHCIIDDLDIAGNTPPD